MKRIYTRTGDKGMTGIHGGERVFKDDIRIEANGCIDELNAVIGIVRSFLPQEHEWQSLLFSIQKNMMAVMSLWLHHQLSVKGILISCLMIYALFVRKQWIH